jgi:hypothetical protein
MFARAQRRRLTQINTGFFGGRRMDSPNAFAKTIIRRRTTARRSLRAQPAAQGQWAHRIERQRARADAIRSRAHARGQRAPGRPPGDGSFPTEEAMKLADIRTRIPEYSLE